MIYTIISSAQPTLRPRPAGKVRTILDAPVDMYITTRISRCQRSADKVRTVDISLKVYSYTWLGDQLPKHAGTSGAPE